MPIKADINKNCFDVIRYICTFTVFLGHFWTHFHIESDVMHALAYSIRGVPVFFFLSGLFIARSIKRYRIVDYLRKRSLRIYPELWICVIVNLIIILICLRAVSIRDILKYLITQLTVFQFYTPEWFKQYGVGVPNGALWTITVDIQFYLIAMLIARRMGGKSWKTWAVAIVLTIALDWILQNTQAIYPETVYKLLMVSLIPFLWIFLLGMGTYYFRDYIIPRIVPMRWLLVLAYVLWQFFVPKHVVDCFAGIRYNILTTLLLILMVISIGFSFSIRMKQDYSYSFYLYHMVVMNLVIQCIGNRFASFQHGAIWFAVLLAATSVCALLSRCLVAVKLTKHLENLLTTAN